MACIVRSVCVDVCCDEVVAGMEGGRGSDILRRAVHGVTDKVCGTEEESAVVQEDVEREVQVDEAACRSVCA